MAIYVISNVFASLAVLWDLSIFQRSLDAWFAVPEVRLTVQAFSPLVIIVIVVVLYIASLAVLMDLSIVVHCLDA